MNKEQQNGCRKCGSEMKQSKAIVCRSTGMSDFIGSKDVVTMSPDPKQHVLVDCLKCASCGWSVSNPPKPTDKKFDLMDYS